MSDKLEKMKKKIAALLAMTKENGASENEAMQAMAVASRLMEEHGVTIDDIRNSTSNDFVKESMDELRKNLHEVDLYLSVAIGKYCDIKSYADANNKMVFFGYAVDVELAKYIRKICKFALEYEWSLFHATYQGSTHGRTLRKSFMIGMTNRLGQRLAELKKETISSSSGTALISLKNQVVNEEFTKQLKIRLNKGGKTKVRFNDAYSAGHSAGDRVNFNKAVYNGDSDIKMIGSK